MGLTGDFAELAKLQQRLEGLATDGKKRISKAFTDEARNLVTEGFQKGQAPTGTPWLAPKYRTGQPLRDSGILANSIDVHDTGEGFVLATSVMYAHIHQNGAVITVKHAKQLYSKKLGRGFGKRVKIPARPFLPVGALPAPWLARLSEVVEDALDAFFPDR